MVLNFLVYKPLYPRTPPGATVNHIPNVTLFQRSSPTDCISVEYSVLRPSAKPNLAKDFT